MVDHVAGQITLAQIALHSSSTDCWTAIGGNVYNLSAFIPDHPNTRILVLCGAEGRLLDGLCCALLVGSFPSHTGLRQSSPDVKLDCVFPPLQ